MGKDGNNSSLENAFLNLMRFGAAFSILVYHFYLLVPNYTGNTIGIDSYPFEEWLGFLYSHGFLSVQAFWIISGYVLSKAYLNRKWVIFDFLRNRFARLYPLHISTLLIVALIQQVNYWKFSEYRICQYQDLRHLALNLLFIPSIGLEKGCSYNAPIWSVSVEIFAYIIFALAITVTKKYNLVLSIVLASTSLLIYSLQIPFIPTRVAASSLFFFTGSAIYLYGIKTRKYPYIVFLFMVGFVFLKKQEFYLFNINLKESDIPWALFFSTILLVQKWLSFRMNKRLKFLEAPSVFLGNMTYSSYLIQFPIIILWLFLVDYLSIQNYELYLSWVLIGYLASVLILARLSYVFIESPTRKKLRAK